MEPPSPTTLRALLDSGYTARSVRDEIRDNLLAALKAGTPLFPGIIGYEDTVVPALENAVLCGHDVIFLGERGQAKTRMIRGVSALLDEWMPIIRGTETRDDPLAPSSPEGRRIAAELGDDTPIAWVHRDERYVEKLATPDVSVADLVGDIDPMKVAEGRSLGDPSTMHFGLLPRANRGIFCVNELPDLSEKVQVALFNLMQERDVQIKGYNVRLPLDVLVLASANPDDYTSRGRIIAPLKDRYSAQIRTHYPKTRALELSVVEQEARPVVAPGVTVTIPDFMKDVIAEITFQARASPDVNQASGVSVRLSISNYETLTANAVRRALSLSEPEAVPRMSDLAALSASTLGKLELEYSGRDLSPEGIVNTLIRRAALTVFQERLEPSELDPVVEAFDQGWQVEVSAALPSVDYLTGLDEIPGLRAVAERIGGGSSPALVASAVEFLLEGLHLSGRLNRTEHLTSVRFERAEAR